MTDQPSQGHVHDQIGRWKQNYIHYYALLQGKKAMTWHSQSPHANYWDIERQHTGFD